MVHRESGFLTIQGVQTYYEVAGDGEPILFIHGIDSDSRMWDKQVEVLSKSYKTIRFDLRGFGQTPMPLGEFHIQDDINHLMELLEIPSAHIIGYSFGGTVSLPFALKYPERVKSIILAGAGMVGYDWSDELSTYFREFQQCWSNGNWDEMMRLLKWKSIYGPHRNEHGLVEICSLLDKMFLHAMKNVLREGKPISPGDTRDRLHTVKVPTLILVGEMDFEDYHHIAEIYNQSLSNSIKKIVPDVGHFINLENPSLFNEITSNFIRNQNN
ncbi:alpha/beta hydrolase [Bacillus sp. BGMRC 2118]|nr:alpha/beta hydrolase [Bacillus sp. BGMRC 2118]